MKSFKRLTKGKSNTDWRRRKKVKPESKNQSRRNQWRENRLPFCLLPPTGSTNLLQTSVLVLGPTEWILQSIYSKPMLSAENPELQHLQKMAVQSLHPRRIPRQHSVQICRYIWLWASFKYMIETKTLPNGVCYLGFQDGRKVVCQCKKTDVNVLTLNHTLSL